MAAIPPSTMRGLTVAKFGGSTIGLNGESVPDIIERINQIAKESKAVCVFSAPPGTYDGRTRSVTDMILDLGAKAEAGKDASLEQVESTYRTILKHADASIQDECKGLVKNHLGHAAKALKEAKKREEFADEVRAAALAHAGELLMSHIMAAMLRGAKINAAAVPFDSWPIITDDNMESSNFLRSESLECTGPLENIISNNDAVTIGGFVGKTAEGTITTFERGGSDRTAADLGILLHQRYDAHIILEKDGAVVSADPRIVSGALDKVGQLSYNEARLAGMFGMSILDPVAIKEILENGVDIPVVISEMKNPKNRTIIKRKPDPQKGHPLKIVTGKRNCAIFRTETGPASSLIKSLKEERRYGEYIILSPFTKDGTEFTRMLFLDADYVRRNEKYLLGFDSLASITYGRGVITLIGDEMWRVQQVASRTSHRLGQAGLNILNMDAQEETSRIIMVIEDEGANVEDAIRAVHDERARIKFI